MIGREWERRKAWSVPVLIRRGSDFIVRCPRLFLLFSFEGAILHIDSAGQIFIEAYGDLDKLDPAAIAGWPTCSHPEHRS